jgi:hypothetical protein
MADPQRPAAAGVPHDPSSQEPAEGSRDNVNVEQIGNDDRREAGISNRPIEEEQREQQNLPPRGRAKDDDRA